MATVRLLTLTLPLWVVGVLLTTSVYGSPAKKFPPTVRMSMAASTSTQFLDPYLALEPSPPTSNGPKIARLGVPITEKILPADENQRYWTSKPQWNIEYQDVNQSDVIMVTAEPNQDYNYIWNFKAKDANMILKVRCSKFALPDCNKADDEEQCEENNHLNVISQDDDKKTQSQWYKESEVLSSIGVLTLHLRAEGKDSSTRPRLLCTVTAEPSEGLKAPESNSACGAVTGKCGLRPTPARLLGANDVTQGSWPWAAQVGVKGQSDNYPAFRCGATLIHPEWVLTTAQCIYYAQYHSLSLDVIVGAHNLSDTTEVRQRIPVVKMEKHPAYDENYLSFNVGLLQLERPVSMTNSITPACLPEDGEEKYNYDGEDMTLVGWGGHEDAFPSDVPKEANLIPWNWNECRDQYDDNLHISMMCASNLTARPCYGDSGSGLMWQEPVGEMRWSVLGVTSYKYGCARPGKPYTFADVPHVVTWIMKRIGCEGAESNRPHHPSPTEMSCGEHNVGDRIVGGTETDPNEFPYQAGLEYLYNGVWYGPYCGAVVISNTYVLTIAHCIHGLSSAKLKVRIGYHNVTMGPYSYRYPVRKILEHEKFDYGARDFLYDIALITLAEPLNFHHKHYVAPACLPERDASYEDKKAIAVGWGADFETFGNKTYIVYHDALQKVEVNIISNEECEVFYNQSMPATFLCAGTKEGGKDACWGDGGGPLLVKDEDDLYIVVGLVSWGIGCAQKEYPGVYTRVSIYLDWINENTHDLQTNY